MRLFSTSFFLLNCLFILFVLFFQLNSIIGDKQQNKINIIKDGQVNGCNNINNTQNPKDLECKPLNKESMENGEKIVNTNITTNKPINVTETTIITIKNNININNSNNYKTKNQNISTIKTINNNSSISTSTTTTTISSSSTSSIKMTINKSTKISSELEVSNIKPTEELDNSNLILYIIIIVLLILVIIICCCCCCRVKKFRFLSRLKRSAKIIRKQKFSIEDCDPENVYFKPQDFTIKEGPVIIKKQSKFPEEETLNENLPENLRKLDINFTNQMLVVYEVGSELDMVVDSEGNQIENSPPVSWRNTYEAKIKRGNYEDYIQQKKDMESDKTSDSMSTEFETDKSIESIKGKKIGGKKINKEQENKMKKEENEQKKKKEKENKLNDTLVKEIKEIETAKSSEEAETQRDVNEANIQDMTTETTIYNNNETNEGNGEEENNNNKEEIDKSEYIK